MGPKKRHDLFSSNPKPSRSGYVFVIGNCQVFNYVTYTSYQTLNVLFLLMISDNYRYLSRFCKKAKISLGPNLSYQNIFSRFKPSTYFQKLNNPTPLVPRNRSFHCRISMMPFYAATRFNAIFCISLFSFFWNAVGWQRRI